MGIKYTVNSNFFATWSNEMAYVLGYFYADGGLENSTSIRGTYIRFSSADKNLLKNVCKIMKSKHLLFERKQISRRKNFLLRIGDRKLYNDLVSIGLYPNKSLTITLPSVPEMFLEHFIRGYFDGDGCVHIERQQLKDGRKSIKRLHTSFTSGSQQFLLDLNNRIKNTLDVNSPLYKNGNAFQLRYNTHSSVKLFTLMYRKATKLTSLQRKKILFKKFFIERKNWIDSDIQIILNNL